MCEYAGETIDGKEFDSSFKRGKPAVFAPNQVHYRICTLRVIYPPTALRVTPAVERSNYSRAHFFAYLLVVVVKTLFYSLTRNMSI